MHDLLLFLEGLAVICGLIVLAISFILWLIEMWSPRSLNEMQTVLEITGVLAPFRALRGLLTERRTKSCDVGRKSRSRERTTETSGTHHFRTVLEAKGYLAEQIGKEAERTGTPLTEIERKMLYFSETASTLPGILQISAEFERDYDETVYEQKIGNLVRAIEARLANGDEAEFATWNAACNKLSRGDHYLLVLMGQDRALGGLRPLWMRLLATVVALTAVYILRIWTRQWTCSR
jgi:hypothetical protein